MIDESATKQELINTLSALQQVGLELDPQLDLDTRLRSIVSRAIDLLDGTSGTIYLHRPVHDDLELRVAVGSEMPIGTILKRGEGVAGKVLESGEPLIVDDYRQWQGRATVYDSFELKAVLGVPIRWGQETLGILDMLADPPRIFSPSDAELMSLLASQAAIAIRNVRLLTDLKRRGLQLETIADIARSTGTILDPETLMDLAVNLIQERFSFCYVGIFVTDESGEYAVLKSGTGEAGRAMLDAGHRLPLGGQSMIGWAIANTQPRVAQDVNQETMRFKNPLLPQVRSEMALPLTSRGQCIGALTVQSAEDNAFSAEDIAILHTMADQLAIAIDNARLYEAAQQEISERKRAEEALQQRNRQLALLNQASRTLTATLDLDQVLAIALDEIRNLMNVIACSVWLVDQGTGELVCRQVTDPHKDIVRGWRLAPGHGLAGYVVQTGESLIVPDTRADERHFKGVDERTGLALRSILTTPLRIKDEVIGVIQVVDVDVDRFSPADLSLLEPLASTVAIAIENARLYEQARQDAETRSRLLREVNHRVKNNLAIIVGILYAGRRRVKLEDMTTYQSFMEDMISRVQGLATVHGLLSASKWRPLELKELITQVIHASLRTLPQNKPVSINVSPSSIRVSPKQADSLALVINELVTNTIKYAFSEQSGVHITVHIQQEQGITQFEFRDNGPGYPPDVLSLDRFNVGLYLVQTIVRDDLQGDLALCNDQGAVTTIRFRAFV